MADDAAPRVKKRRHQFRPEDIVMDEELEKEVEQSKRGGFAKTTETMLKSVMERWAAYVQMSTPDRSADLQQAPIVAADERMLRAFLISIKHQGFSVNTVKTYFNALCMESRRCGQADLAVLFPRLMRTVSSHLLRTYGQEPPDKKKGLSPDDMRHLCSVVGLGSPSAILDCLIVTFACITGKRRSSMVVDEDLGCDGVYCRDIEFLWPAGTTPNMISFTATIHHEKTTRNAICSSKVTVTSVSDFLAPWNLPLQMLAWLEAGGALVAGSVSAALETRDLRISPAVLDRALFVCVGADEQVTWKPLRNLQHSVRRSVMKAGYSPLEVTHKSGRVSLLNNSLRRHYLENGAQVAADAGTEAKRTAVWTSTSNVPERDYRRDDKQGDSSGAVMGETAERRAAVSEANLVTRWRERLPDDQIVWTVVMLRAQSPAALAERIDADEDFQARVQQCEETMRKADTTLKAKRRLLKELKASYNAVTDKALLQEVHGRVCAQRQQYVGRGHPNSGSFEAASVAPIDLAVMTASLADSRAAAAAKCANLNVDEYWYAIKARLGNYLNTPAVGEESPEKSGSGMRLFQTKCGECAACQRTELCRNCDICKKEGALYTDGWKKRFCPDLVCEQHSRKVADKRKQKTTRSTKKRADKRRKKREEREAAWTPAQRRRTEMRWARERRRKEAAAAAAAETSEEETSSEDGDAEPPSAADFADEHTDAPVVENGSDWLAKARRYFTADEWTKLGPMNRQRNANLIENYFEETRLGLRTEPPAFMKTSASVPRKKPAQKKGQKTKAPQKPRASAASSDRVLRQLKSPVKCIDDSDYSDD